MGQYITTYKALDILAPEWSLNSKALYDHIVRENELNDKLEARNILHMLGIHQFGIDFL